jgi:hypothetical protein
MALVENVATVIQFSHGVSFTSPKTNSQVDHKRIEDLADLPGSDCSDSSVRSGREPPEAPGPAYGPSEPDAEMVLTTRMLIDSSCLGGLFGACVLTKPRRLLQILQRCFEEWDECWVDFDAMPIFQVCR